MLDSCLHDGVDSSRSSIVKGTWILGYEYHCLLEGYNSDGFLVGRDRGRDDRPMKADCHFSIAPGLPGLLYEDGRR